jgi:GNAT superfamily N-acetyltransferase
MTVTIKFATAADIPELLQLRLLVDSDQARRFGNGRWKTTINEKSIARGLRSSRVLIARRRGQIIGTLRMETKKPWAIDLRYFTPATCAVYLHDVDVDPRVQRSGVGRQLIEQAKAVAREWPVDAIRLDAYDGPSGGGPFYEKCGFIEVGRKVYRGVPLVYFECLLRQLPDLPSSTSRKQGDESAG